MDTWRLNTKSITKYNPQYRDEEGRYLLDEWTSFSDIGKEFNGVIFTEEEYLTTEGNYIKAAIFIFESVSCNVIVIKNIEKYSDEIIDEGLQRFYNDLKEDFYLTLDNIGNAITLILRDNLWCELHCLNNPNVVVRFGYDYYMYANGISSDSYVWEQIREIGLFV